MSILKVYKYLYYINSIEPLQGMETVTVLPLCFFLHFCHFLLAGEEGSSEVASCHVRLKEVSSIKCLG